MAHYSYKRVSMPDAADRNGDFVLSVRAFLISPAPTRVTVDSKFDGVCVGEVVTGEGREGANELVASGQMMRSQR